MYTVYKEMEFEDIAIFSAFTKIPYNFKVSTYNFKVNLHLSTKMLIHLHKMIGT